MTTEKTETFTGLSQDLTDLKARLNAGDQTTLQEKL